ncbi:MAG: hypothetical protein MZU91_11060 [Desulfosudis oleivorans]|nr:hypothetical protein [Desulfosudis oleivorans]
MKKHALLVAVAATLLASAVANAQAPARPAADSVVQRIIELGATDNRVMTWNDYASNRFGGRESGTNAYNDAAEWAVWQFRQWGLEAELDDAGEVPGRLQPRPLVRPDGQAGRESPLFRDAELHRRDQGPRARDRSSS